MANDVVIGMVIGMLIGMVIMWCYCDDALVKLLRYYANGTTLVR